MLRNAFEGWHLVILAVLIFALFGWKKMPEMTRSLGRSMRIFKSEMNEMKQESTTVKGETVKKPAATRAEEDRLDTSVDPIDEPSTRSESAGAKRATED